jgi:hypothetical protein
MKALSVRPPWAWAILNAGKDVENRTWKTSIRGAIAVHSSQTMSRPYYEWALEEIKKVVPGAKVPPYAEMVRGSIVGLVDIIACKEHTKSRWQVSGHYGFVLANPRALRDPIPCSGRLNFWEVPDSIARRVSCQVK